MTPPPEIQALCAAGPVAEIARVGYAPFDLDDPLEIRFADGRLFYVDVGVEGASDLRIGEGPLLEAAYGHLRAEEPETFAAIARDWSREALDLPWLTGQRLGDPRRLAMTAPYRVEVGYAFQAGERRLALFAEADLIYAAALDDPNIAAYRLAFAE